MSWTVEVLDDRVRAEIEELRADIRARFQRIVDLIQSYGLERVREPHLKRLAGPFWEMRMRGKDALQRIRKVTGR